MAALVVSIAGRSYRIACGDGEEARLEELVRYVESKIFSMHESFGEIGEQRLNVMAAIAIADEAADARDRVQALELELKEIREKIASLETLRQEESARHMQIISESTARIERAIAALNKQTVARNDFV
ncbi:MAG: cell division protein ZapA [Methylocystaceae bacterium]|jgi:cell division protein ZapA|nr:cell division protein ZapA [Methylocystaceae bacterium]